MNEKTGPYQIVDLSPARRVWLNILDLPRPTQSMYGLLEVDVTVARQLIAEHKARTGETLSFTGFLTYCLAARRGREQGGAGLPKRPQATRPV